jgi:hypothetical protein
MYQELGSLYRAFAFGDCPDLPELPIQYGDFALWQQRYLQEETLEDLRSYWVRQLAGAPVQLDLPADRPRMPVQSLRGARFPFTLPLSLLDAASAISLASGVTPFMSLCAAFNVLLFCYTGQEDICIGSPVAPRRRLETEKLIGFFANTVVLRTNLTNNPTFRDVMRRVMRTVIETIAHAELPFNMIVEAVRPPRDLSRMPLCQANFRVVKAAITPLQIPGLRIRGPEWIDTRTSKFDLALELVASGEPGGFFEYSTDLFDEQTISRMAEDFQALLKSVLAEPDVPLGEIPVVQEIRERYGVVPPSRNPSPSGGTVQTAHTT